MKKGIYGIFISITLTMILVGYSCKNKNQEINLERPFTLIVDYSKTTMEMIRAGKYDSPAEDGTLFCNFIDNDKFPLPVELMGEKSIISVKLFHFYSGISSENAIIKMDQASYRPANLVELLSLGATYPEAQRDFAIIALGTVWQANDVYCFAPFLSLYLGERRLELHDCKNKWSGIMGQNCRFLAVHK